MTQNQPESALLKPLPLDTPALCLDLDVFEKNVRFMVETCRRCGIDWRPHAKCHKSSIIANHLVSAGAVGVTCATIDEAEEMAAGGVQDLLIANMVAGQRKIDRLIQLSRMANPMVCIDHLQQAASISTQAVQRDTKVRVLVELDIGLQRVGVNPGDIALDLVKDIRQLPGIRFAGVMAYEGHLLTIEDPDDKVLKIRKAIQLAVDTKSQIEQAGITCPIVSCGGTGSFPITSRIAGVTELQAGGAIFMDMFYRQQCQIKELDHALTVAATVVSRPAADRAVIDAGRKSMNIEIHVPQVANMKGVTVHSLSAEHGVLSLEKDAPDLPIGSQIQVIPGYADLTVALYDHFFALRDGCVAKIIPIGKRKYSVEERESDR